MKIIFLVLLATCLSAAGQGTSVAGSDEFVITGHVVAYDWLLHETTSDDDFIVKVKGGASGASPFVRIIHQGPFYWDAITVSGPRIERTAFLARGPARLFKVRTPKNKEERQSCSGGFSTVHFEDELGKGTIDLVGAPGAPAEVPRGTSRCFILVSPTVEKEK
jgi:hypothetical protein